MDVSIRKRDWGVVQALRVEADTMQALKGAVMIAMTDHKKVTHFRVDTINDSTVMTNGANRITLLWHAERPGLDNELPFELTTVDEVTDFIVQWLEKKAKYPDEIPDTDGSVEKGFLAENTWDPFYSVIRITPTYIVYGK